MRKMDEKPAKLTLSEKPRWAWSYAACLVLVYVLVAVSHARLRSLGFVMPEAVVWIEVGMVSCLVILMVISMLRKKATYMWWEAVIWILGLCGIWILALATLPVWIAIIVAAMLSFISFFVSITILHDIVSLIGATGVGLLAAWQFPYSVMLICTSGVAIYEVVRDRDMGLATLFSEARKTGIVPGVLLPGFLSGWYADSFRTWSPGAGQIVGLLPFMAISAMAFHVAGRGAIFLGAVALLTVSIVSFWGQDKRGVLRPWVIPAAAVGVYAVYGVIKLAL